MPDISTGSRTGFRAAPRTTLPTLLSAALLAAVALLPVAAAGQERARTWTAEQQAVIDALSGGPIGIEEEAAFEAWASGYHPDWTYWRLGTDSTRPRDEHMALVREYVGAGNHVVAFELEPVDVIVRGDTALVRLNAVETIREADGGTRVARYSSAAMMVREQRNWQLLATNILHQPDAE